MDILRLRAYAARMNGWAFYVKDIQSGLLFPVMRGTFCIKTTDPDISSLLVMECEVDLIPENSKSDKRLLRLSVLENEHGRFLACKQGQVSLCDLGTVNDSRVRCTVVLDGFGQEDLR